MNDEKQAGSEIFLLPTGKNTVSFSEIQTWSECSWRHKLRYVDKIELGREHYAAYFGTAIHASCEDFLRNREMDESIAIAHVAENWEKIESILSDHDRKTVTLDSLTQLIHDILVEVPQFIDTQFPGWEYVASEHRLNESIVDQPGVFFKGFIDGIISVPDKRGNPKYWIIDWKTASWGWGREKRGDFTVQLQLRLYKSFWAQAKSVPMSDIRCGFVLLKKTAKEGNRCELVTVSVGEETARRSLKVMNNMVGSVKRGTAIKNRNSCKYCEFLNTPHCP